ncbi:MAG: hypothetical protein VW491_01255 [Gammaproteobacteria bacterium]
MVDRDTQFRYWQRALFVLHYVSASGLAISLSHYGDWEVPVVMRYNVWRGQSGDRASCASGCRIYEYETVVGTLQVGVVVCLFSFVSGAHHFVAGLPPLYDSDVSLLRTIKRLDGSSRGVNVVRWIDYGISASLMLAVNSIMWLSPPTLHQLIHTAAVMAAVVAAGYGSEAAWSAGSKGHPTWVFLAACVPFVMSWCATFLQYDASMSGPTAGDYSIRGGLVAVEDGAAKPPEFVKIILIVLAATYCLFPIAHAYRLTTDPQTCDVIWMESVYGALSFVAKIPLLAVYGTAVATRSAIVDIATSDNVDNVAPDGNADTTVQIVAGVASFVSTVLGVAMCYSMRIQARTGDSANDASLAIKTSTSIM